MVAPIGLRPSAPPTWPASESASVATDQLPISGECEIAGHAPPPALAHVRLDHAIPLLRVDEAVDRNHDAAMRGGVLPQPEQHQLPGLRRERADQRMSSPSKPLRRLASRQSAP
jgi:hypothetical protein